jgi:hypothetical protein
VLVLLIGITTLVLALIPIGINDKIARPNEIYICSSQTKDFPHGSLTYLDIDEDERDEISNIYSKFSHSFEQNLLSAIFRGEVNSEIGTNYNRVSNYIGKNTSNEDKITIVFKYKQSQKIHVEEKSTTYNSIIFEITSKDERVDVVMGVSSNLNIENSTFYYNYSYVAKANFAGLYNFVVDLINN